MFVAYTMFNRQRRIRLKKFIILLCFTISVVSIYIIIDTRSEVPVFKLEPDVPIEELRLNSGGLNDALSLGKWQDIPDDRRKFDELKDFLPANGVKESYRDEHISHFLIEDDNDKKPIHFDLQEELAVPYPTHNIYYYNAVNAKHVIVPNAGLSHDTGKIDNKRKHLLILGHYEQLGKTTVNFFQAAKLAYLMRRVLVKPYVRDSRFCGLTSGWTGSLRKNTRSFFPLDLYFNVSALERFFQRHKFGNMEYLETFRKSCSYENNQRRIVIVYFMYHTGEAYQRGLFVSQNELKEIELLLYQSPGWIDCSFINKRLNVDTRIGDHIKAGRQYCIDPNKVVDVNILENEILKNDPCVVFHQWKGTGSERTHFNLTGEIPHDEFLRHVTPSDFVISEMRRFTRILGSDFIGVHIRAERQLMWYNIRKYTKCMDMVLRQVQKIREAKKISFVFLSADVGPYGSDTIRHSLNEEEMRVVTNKFHWLVNKLNATTYSVLKEKHHIWTDSGLAAFTQLHILSLASHLVTLGSGTFQKWIIDKFKKRKLSEKNKSWTITRACFLEDKNWRVNGAHHKKVKH